MRSLFHPGKSNGIVLIALILFLLFSCAGTPHVEEKGVEEKPVVIEETYSSIGFYVSTGDIEKAIAAFEEAYSRDPEDPETKVLYSNLLMAGGRLEEAAEILRGVLNEAPGNIDALYNLALLEGFSGNKEAELDILKHIIEVDPVNSRAHASIGEIRMEEKNYKGARESFEVSLSEDPENIVALLGFGNLLMREGDLEKSEELLSRAIENEPDYVFGYIDRSRTRSYLDDIPGAIDDITRAIELDPGFYWNYIDRGKIRLVDLHDHEGALDDFNRAIEIDDEYFLAYVYRAGIQNDLGRYAESLQDYLKVVEKKTDYYFAYKPLGILLFMSEEYSKAREYLSRAYAYERGNHYTQLLILLSYVKEGNTKGAEQFYREARLPADSLFYHVGRVFIDPGYITHAIDRVSKEKDSMMKARMLYYLGSWYLTTDTPTVGARLLMEAAEADIMDVEEKRLAVWELETTF
ncbi:MAG: tetratricopeptide repeat protein [Spirochaetales bacterium]|nr:tetratricopeptide repeat protein [Spirochaetales bacterium]